MSNEDKDFQQVAIQQLYTAIAKIDDEDLLGRLNRAEKILKYQGEQLLDVTEMIDVIQTRKSGEALQEPKDLPAQERESLDEDPIL